MGDAQFSGNLQAMPTVNDVNRPVRPTLDDDRVGAEEPVVDAGGPPSWQGATRGVPSGEVVAGHSPVQARPDHLIPGRDGPAVSAPAETVASPRADDRVAGEVGLGDSDVSQAAGGEPCR